MKSFILIAVLAALTVCNSASIPDKAELFGEGVPVYEAGSIGRQAEIIIHDQVYFRDTNGNNTVSFDVEYNGNATTRVTGVRVYNPPQNPGYVNIGPLGNSHITVSLVTPPGVELASWVVIFGRII